MKKLPILKIHNLRSFKSCESLNPLKWSARKGLSNGNYENFGFLRIWRVLGHGNRQNRQNFRKNFYWLTWSEIGWNLLSWRNFREKRILKKFPHSRTFLRLGKISKNFKIFDFRFLTQNDQKLAETYSAERILAKNAFLKISP